MPEERLQKILSQAGVASRRHAEQMIVEGRVTVNGAVVTQLGSKADLERDSIKADGKLVRPPKRLVYLALHKPNNTVTTVSDPQNRATVMDLLRGIKERVYPVGRLDYHSEGLLLLTNDGELARHLELPQNAWLRHYRVRVYGKVDAAKLTALAKGVTISGIYYEPIKAVLEKEQGTNAWLSVSLREGKNREIRKIMDHLGLQVSRLIRTSFGPFPLGTLPPGAVEEVPRRALRGALEKFFEALT